jgi:hypothetical protein
MIDPNWFYSALAQSAAAIVGLIGAFVTSRVMMMAGERSRIEKRIQEVNAEIKELERQNAPLSEYIGDMDKKYAELEKEELPETSLSRPLLRPGLDSPYMKYQRVRGENNKEISYKKAKIEELQQQVSQIILPEHFKGLIFSLIYFTIVGVIFPLWLLPITPEQHLVLKPIVLVFFITGLFAIFLYIFIEIKHITEKPKNARTAEETSRDENGAR